MLNHWNAIRGLNADVRRMLLLWVCMNFGFFGIIGVLMNLYLLRLGFDVQFIGLFNATGQFVWAAMSLPAGILLRRMGLKRGMLFGVLLIAVSTTLLLLVEWLPRPWWGIWLMGTWSLQWLGVPFFIVASTPYMILAAGAEGRNYVFSVNGALAALMSFAGSMAAGVLPGWLAVAGGGTLDDVWPYRLALWTAPIAYMFGALFLMRASPLASPVESGQDANSRVPLKLFLLLGMAAFLPALGSGAMRAFFNVFLDVELAVHPSQIGTVMGVSQLIPIPMVLVTPLLLGRWGAPRAMAVVGAVMSAALVLVGVSGHWAVAGLGFGTVFMAMAINGPASSIYSQELVSARWRTLSPAVISIGMALGWSVSAALGGLLIGDLGFRGFFFVCAGLVFVSTPMLLTFLRRQQARAQPLAAD